MFDMAWSEFLVVIAVAVLVIGPKDIPKVLQGLGKVMRRMHYLKFALSQQFEDLMKETDLEELRQINKAAAEKLPEILIDTDEAAADAEDHPDEEEGQDDRSDIASTSTTQH